MNRDFDKTVANANVNIRYDMDCVTMKELVERGSLNTSSLFNVIYDTFKFGYVMGQRSTRTKA